jgi:glycosyltransferase involved in cell wall biosynthesis
MLATVTVGITIIRVLLSRSPKAVESPGLVVLDVSYTLDQVRGRELEAAMTARSCSGLFSHVWSVHPMVGADGSTSDTGPLRISELSASHTVIEARLSSSKKWNRMPLSGFAFSQSQLLGELCRLVKSGQVSAVRVGDPYYVGLLGYLVSRCGRIPLTLRIGADYDDAYKKTGKPVHPRLLRSRRLEKRIEHFVLTRSVLTVAPSVAYESFAVANGARPETCVIVPFGGLLHPAHFDEPSDRHSIRDEVGLDQRPLVVSVMRLEPVKHAVDLVGVLDLVRRDCPNVVFAVVGDGSQRGEMLARTRELGLDGSLFLLGNRGQRWIASLLADADVIAAPMMGRALVEAALSGTPIVAYDVDWHGELIDDGETGVLVPFGDREAMARAILRMLDDPDYVVELGSQARRAAMDAMSREVVSRAEREAWLRVLPLAGVHVGPRGSRMPDDDTR